MTARPADAAAYAAAMREADPRLRAGASPGGWRDPQAVASAQATESRAEQAGRDDPDGLKAGLAAEAETAADDVDAARRIFAWAQAEASRRSRAASEVARAAGARGQQPGDQQ